MRGNFLQSFILLDLRATFKNIRHSSLSMGNGESCNLKAETSSFKKGEISCVEFLT